MKEYSSTSSPDRSRKPVEITQYGRFPVVIDYDQPIEELIQERRFEWSGVVFTNSNFPASETGKTSADVFLLGFSYPVGSVDAVKEMGVLGFCPANLRALITLDSTYPFLQRRNPIAALGTGWRCAGYLYVPCLGKDRSSRNLGLITFEADWETDWRFAARKAAQAITQPWFE